MAPKLAVFTEDEATQRLCPQRISHPGMGSTRPTCHGSQCMAWRWAEIPNEAGAMGDSLTLGDTHGFCGLAWPPDVGGRLKELV